MASGKGCLEDCKPCRSKGKLVLGEVGRVGNSRSLTGGGYNLGWEGERGRQAPILRVPSSGGGKPLKKKKLEEMLLVVVLQRGSSDCLGEETRYPVLSTKHFRIRGSRLGTASRKEGAGGSEKGKRISVENSRLCCGKNPQSGGEVLSHGKRERNLVKSHGVNCSPELDFVPDSRGRSPAPAPLSGDVENNNLVALWRRKKRLERSNGYGKTKANARKKERSLHKTPGGEASRAQI